MDERLFGQLAGLLPVQPAILASVLHTRGATPRKRGSRMLVGHDGSTGSVGGGMAEARVVQAARDMLAAPEGQGARQLHIELNGRPGAAGVCGGAMDIALRRWSGPADAARAREIAMALGHGETAHLSAAELGADRPAGEQHNACPQAQLLYPDPRLVIVGAGHCGLALYQMARLLEFDLWVHDERPGCFAGNQFHGATVLCGDAELLVRSAATARTRMAVLLTRDFRRDVAALAALLRDPPAFVGMMGSRRRIAEVRAALPDHGCALDQVVAPVGVEIGAQTPHEIAVSILAQLVAWRSAAATAASQPA